MQKESGQGDTRGAKETHLMPDQQQKLLDNLKQARRSLLESTLGLDERTAADTTVFGNWTIKDVLAHLVSWGDELRSEIGEILVHPAPRYDYVISSQDDYDQWNQSQVAHKRALSLPETISAIPWQRSRRPR